MLLAWALLMLPVLVAPFLSALPTAAAIALSGLLGVAGAGGWRRCAHRPMRRLVIPGGRGVARVDGLPVAGLRVEWQGPLARVSWRRGPTRRRHALVFWPDTLPPARRRELRLAADDRAVSSRRSSMAP